MLNIAEEFKCFVENYPNYRETWAIDDLRSREFSRLDESGEIYLNYEKAAPYGLSQMRCFTRSLARTVMSPLNYSASENFQKKIEHCKRRFLRFFGADPEEYALLFTATMSKAMHMISSNYDFSGQSRLLLAIDNHRAMDSLVRHAQLQQAAVNYIPVNPQTLALEEKTLLQLLSSPAPSKGNRLLVFPAQSCLSGVRHPLAVIGAAQQLGWQVLLDASSYAPTAPLNLSRYHPEFLTVAFHKMLYLPTCLYALIIKRDVLTALRQHHSEAQTEGKQNAGQTAPIFGEAKNHGPRLISETLDLSNVQSLELGLDLLQDITYPAIDERTQSLTRWLTRKLQNLRHKNRQPAVTLYGPLQDGIPHGPVIALNFKDAQGKIIAADLLLPLFKAAKIGLSQGDCSDPGLCSLATGIDPTATEDERQVWRISLGMCSNFPDVFKFWEVCRQIAGKFN
ncbi:MAG: aminotransferase class V-fold PLP-dependent enzyme [bacterium]|nr:aminotransferase class V-fold PLP-dependent enzyme [bacterium]